MQGLAIEGDIFLEDYVQSVGAAREDLGIDKT